MMRSGDYRQAAPIFEELARRTQKLQLPRTPFLFIQAGRANYLGALTEKGLNLIQHGLALLAEAERWAELARVGERVIAELVEQGDESESRKLTAWLEDVLPADFSLADGDGTKVIHAHPVLPTHCPQCGGPVDSSMVAWRDDVTAECLYCGSAIRTEN
ncbi:hypothetical protein KQH56_02625 [bacterium]|nr:hypothetical protein [bacterium]